MNCRQAVDLMVDSLMDALGDEERERLDAHLRSCAACAAESEAMAGTWAALGRIEAPAPGRRSVHRGGLGSPRLWLRTAAAVVLLTLGGIAGYLARGIPLTSEPTPEATFLLLVRGQTRDAVVPADSLVREYGTWAARLAEDGRLVGSEKLRDEPGRWISGDMTERRTQSDVSGYFVVHAANYAEAVAIARSSPHVRYGGTFEIRQIEQLR